MMVKPPTQDKPFLIPMIGKDRVFGCQCAADQDYVVYTKIQDQETKQCSCGHWFTGYQVKNPLTFTASDVKKVPQAIESSEIKETSEAQETSEVK